MHAVDHVRTIKDIAGAFYWLLNKESSLSDGGGDIGGTRGADSGGGGLHSSISQLNLRHFRSLNAQLASTSQLKLSVFVT